MAVRDSLRVILVANNTQVAVSTDPALWQSVYSSIHDIDDNEESCGKTEVKTKPFIQKSGKWITPRGS